MDVTEALTALGGVAARATLIRATSRASVDEALRTESVVALTHGRYALPVVDEALAQAHAMSGVLSLTSAALHHGWAVKTVPDLPHVTVARSRKVTKAHRALAQIHYRNLDPDEIVGGATSKAATLRDCLRTLPFDEALAIADSALRSGEHRALAQAVAEIHGAGSAQARRVARLARAEAANPFESCLRGIASDVPGLYVEPQLRIITPTLRCEPDLVDRQLRIVLEADSFAWHGDRKALARDARRYNLLVADGWLVLRFTWEDVMFDPDYVRKVLVSTVAVVNRRAEVA